MTENKDNEIDRFIVNEKGDKHLGIGKGRSHISISRWFWLKPREVLKQFAKLPGSRLYLDENKPDGLHSFCYIPGKRKNRVVLVAHVDTVWEDERKEKKISIKLDKMEDGSKIYRSNNDHTGIGADDRAGVAILWMLRNLGHSLLLVDGEESGCVASSNLMKEFPKLSEELNNHQFMVQFDRRGANDCVFYSVGSEKFYEYVQKTTTFVKSGGSSTDITRLCLAGDKGLCGVNLSVGYYHEHTPREKLVYYEFVNTVKRAAKWLISNDLPKFTYEKVVYSPPVSSRASNYNNYNNYSSTDAFNYHEEQRKRAIEYRNERMRQKESSEGPKTDLERYEEIWKNKVLQAFSTPFPKAIQDKINEITKKVVDRPVIDGDNEVDNVDPTIPEPEEIEVVECELDNNVSPVPTIEQDVCPYCGAVDFASSILRNNGNCTSCDVKLHGSAV